MCGIAGVWHSHGTTGDALRQTVERMSDTLAHRGPDDAGTWVEESVGLGFGFRRLAILDLSANGHQPMVSASGRYCIVFNGEVFNFRELADELLKRGHSFRGHSDTEVVLAAFEEWGLDAAVPRFTGMFAMAVWDRDRRSLWLLRDRLGIKPLFLYAGSGVLAFASELKAILSLPFSQRELDYQALARYFQHLYVPAPLSIFRHVTKLLPGHMLEIRDPAGPLPAARPYWSLADVAAAGRAQPFRGDAQEAVEELEAALRRAVALRMRADVPLGAFLSGGIDSSLVVALMQQATSIPVKTFTVGFEQPEHDESTYAAGVASHLGTAHTHLQLAASDVLELVPRMPQVFDEPHADPSQLPTYLVCSAARRDVTVALSGDGGDELFAGYNRYSYGTRVIRAAGQFPPPARNGAAAVLSLLSPGQWQRLDVLRSRALRRPATRLAGEKAGKLARLLKERGEAEMYLSLLAAWRPSPVQGMGGEDPTIAGAFERRDLSLLQRMQLADQHGYLADDLLAKVDRTSMAVSLEVRVPLLDHGVVELSWRLPDEVKLRNGVTKWALREILGRHVPRSLFERPKVGFTAPIADWLRGPLRTWAEELLYGSSLAELPLLDVARVRSEWQRFCRGRSENHLAMWTVVTLQAWRQRWGV